MLDILPWTPSPLTPPTLSLTFPQCFSTSSEVKEPIEALCQWRTSPGCGWGNTHAHTGMGTLCGTYASGDPVGCRDQLTVWGSFQGFLQRPSAHIILGQREAREEGKDHFGVLLLFSIYLQSLEASDPPFMLQGSVILPGVLLCGTAPSLSTYSVCLSHLWVEVTKVSPHGISDLLSFFV